MNAEKRRYNKMDETGMLKLGENPQRNWRTTMKKIGIGIVACVAFLAFAVNASAFLGTFYDSDGYAYSFSIGTNGGEGGFYSLFGDDGECPCTGTAVKVGSDVYVGFTCSGTMFTEGELTGSDYDCHGWLNLGDPTGGLLYWYNPAWGSGGVVGFSYGTPFPETAKTGVSRTGR